MKALVATDIGATPKMALEERPSPEPKAGYTLVKMHAATVNPLSNQIRHGHVPAARAPLVLSNDGSGFVIASDKYLPGARVAIYGSGDLGVKEDGLQQQEVLVANKWIVELPDNISLTEAAALPINYVSAYQAIQRVGLLQSGQTALVSGASGSVGHALIQLINAFGATPIAVVSNTSKVDSARDSGAAHIIDLSKQSLVDSVLLLTNGKGVDLAFDTVAGDILEPLIKSLKSRGTAVSIGFAGGVKPVIDIVDIVVFEKRLLGFDAHLERDEDVQTVISSICRLIEQEKIRPRIDSVFPLAEYEEAYRYLESRKAKGSVLLKLDTIQEET
ncbi:zinc-binding alcohol dehydrogenase family protein [Parahaliea maris]|uniref:Zinc-binding alcohol dehydrogenase family protein n=1 Tax=Parahaliea maris TaxID=2716870 RepID=A0A5C8ZW87_9GAMM|nr:zinc-binding alcohol dehydrogenase family protein [Parahaliea maris]TXS91862.1 zinc-binding alcohol dehydrogenase family protein [Parahaliea maris]